jgi:hypothetical protein
VSPKPSPQKRRANRLNALKSTGPKTLAGKRRASANAAQHGLSVPIDPATAGDKLRAMVALLTNEGLAPERAQDLALRILELERNLAHQRQLHTGKVAEPAASGWLGQLSKKRNRNEPVHAARYLKRAYSQLVKAMRAL